MVYLVSMQVIQWFIWYLCKSANGLSDIYAGHPMIYLIFIPGHPMIYLIFMPGHPMVYLIFIPGQPMVYLISMQVSQWFI